VDEGTAGCLAFLASLLAVLLVLVLWEPLVLEFFQMMLTWLLWSILDVFSRLSS
jgi:hypothetical protein